LQSITNPLERAVVAISRYGSLIGADISTKPVEVVLTDVLAHDAVRAIWPGYNFDLKNSVPWQGAQVTNWFAQRATALGLAPDTRVEVTKEVKGMLGGYKTRKVESGMAWRFAQGSNNQMGDRPRLTVFVFPDGHYVHCQEKNMAFFEESEGNLSAYALYQMGKIIDHVQIRS